MEIHTQDDFIVAIIALALRDRTTGDELDEATVGFLEFIKSQRTDEEKHRLVETADKLEQEGGSFPTSEELKELSEIYHELPRDGWELLEIQTHAH